MAENAVVWQDKNLISITKQLGMTQDITNDTDDLHNQYLGSQKALNTSTRYVRVDNLTAQTDVHVSSSNILTVNGGNNVIVTDFFKNITWEDGEGTAAPFDDTDYLPFAKILNLTTGSGAGTHRSAYIHHINTITADGCRIHVGLWGETVAGALSRVVNFDLAVWGIKFGV